MSVHPPITAPVVRHIGVADTVRGTAFYRDVLGFEVRGDALERGPARIHLGPQGYSPNDWDHPRPPGSSMLFFETDDAAGMRSAIEARGGRPSEIEKVNWVKMRMFEVRDPDGNTIWFGQSYDEPAAVSPKPMMHKSLPDMPLDDVAAGVAHYRDVLGFHVNYQQDGLGVMDRDQVTFLLTTRTERHKGIGAAYVYVENADMLWAELRAKGANVQGEPVSHPWGLRDFQVLDPEGNQITFGQPFE